jgi:hypothetical protein
MASSVEVIPGPSGGAKTCAVCGIPKPATGFYYHKDKHSYDGWCPKCKECRLKDRRTKRNKEIKRHVDQVELDLLRKIGNGEVRVPMCDVISGGEIVLAAFGGMEGLAMKLASDYEAADIGSAGRTKLLLGALMFVSKGMEKQSPVDLGAMSDEELMEQLDKYMKHGRITQEPENPGPVGSSE